MDTRRVRELRILLPAVEDSDLIDGIATDSADLRYRRVDALDWARLTIADTAVSGCHFYGTMLQDSAWENTTISATRFEQVNLSSARWERAKIERTSFTGCQLSGFSVTDATMSNVIFENCRLDYATFSGVRTTGAVAFVNCTFTEASMAGCRWNEVVFDQCRTANLEFEGCDLQGSDLRGNPLDNIRGINSLRGATITAGQLTELTHALITDLDLQIGDPPTS